MKANATVSLAALLAAARICAQDPQPNDPPHQQLRSLRNDLIAAVTSGDFESVFRHVHPDAVVTWQTNEVCRGHQGLRDFFTRTGKDAFRGYKVPPTPDTLTILHGDDTGISFGETIANYRLLGKDMEMKSRWTATVVRQDGRWLLAGYHLSMNVLDNPLLNGAKQALWAAGATALTAGLAAGIFLGRRRRNS